MISPPFAHCGAPQTEPALTENARKVLEARYLKKNERGECVETPGTLFRRVARTIAAVESQYGASDLARQEWEDRFYRLLAEGDFMPNSPTLMNAGREMGMLSACFVLPVRDSIVEIFDSIKHTAMIQKAGGGTGFAFDELRPTGDYIASSGGTTSGPISFWRAFSEATNAIQQGAFRRGANMGMMYIHHPDILKFLHAKQDLEQFTNYNISVKVTDQWMEEFLRDPDSPHVVRNPRTGQAFVLPRDLDVWKYNIRSLIPVDCVEPIGPGDRRAYFTTPKITGELPAELRGGVYTKADVWSIIVNNAWQTGEPGVVFIDRINETNPTPHVGRIEATNPCGEQPLLPYEACNLGSINLGNVIRNECTPQAGVDWRRLQEVVFASVRFLDNVIDANNYPLAEIDAICKGNRKIGLGVMGFADALYKLGVPYNSEEGVAWGERFMKFVHDEAHNYSEYLARERGPFPNWKGSVWHTRHNRLMRNAAATTVAPTGTISIIANCSGGIEPMFSLAFYRNVLRGQKQGEKPLVEVNEVFRRVARQRGFYSQELMERIATEGTLAHIEGVPEDVRRVFVCAHDITPEWHMRMQAAFQRHNDSSISKTINFRNSATVEEVEQIYKLAYELRCKGVTVYRDGCRAYQPMALKESGKKHLTLAGSLAQPPSAVSVAQPPPAVRGAEATSAATVEATDRVSGDATERRSAKGECGGPARPALPLGEPAAQSSAFAPEPARRPGDEAWPTREVEFPIADSSPEPAPGAASVQAPPASAGLARLEPADLPEIVSGLRIRQMTPFGNMHVKITVDPHTERELEVFAQLGKGGDVANSDLEAICRTASLWLRAGGGLRPLIKQWEGIGSSLQIPTRAGRIMSLPDGLAAALKKYLRAKERFGLRALLLGEVDLSELDKPAPPHSDDAALDRPLDDPAGHGGNGGRTAAGSTHSRPADSSAMESSRPRLQSDSGAGDPTGPAGGCCGPSARIADAPFAGLERRSLLDDRVAQPPAAVKRGMSDAARGVSAGERQPASLGDRSLDLSSYEAARVAQPPAAAIGVAQASSPVNRVAQPPPAVNRVAQPPPAVSVGDRFPDRSLGVTRVAQPPAAVIGIGLPAAVTCLAAPDTALAPPRPGGLRLTALPASYVAQPPVAAIGVAQVSSPVNRVAQPPPAMNRVAQPPPAVSMGDRFPDRSSCAATRAGQPPSAMNRVAQPPPAMNRVAQPPPAMNRVAQPPPAVSVRAAPAASGLSAAGFAAAARPLRHYHEPAAFYKLKCPECGGALAMQEGCRKCWDCGWSAC